MAFGLNKPTKGLICPLNKENQTKKNMQSHVEEMMSKILAKNKLHLMVRLLFLQSVEIVEASLQCYHFPGFTLTRDWYQIDLLKIILYSIETQLSSLLPKNNPRQVWQNRLKNQFLLILNTIDTRKNGDRNVNWKITMG